MQALDSTRQRTPGFGPKTLRQTRPICRTLAILGMLLLAQQASAQSSNFNDGTDTGWTRYDPLSAAGNPPAQYTFPNGAYRIQAPGSIDTADLGPGRAGSLRTDVNYTTFSVAVDLVTFDASHDQAVGFLTRVTNPGLGSTNGYAFTYSTVGNSIDLSRVTGERAHGLKSASITLDPSQDYRLVFTGVGSSLTGSVYSSSDLSTPLASISATDATYDHGINGLVVFDNTTAGTLGADGTFDNYVATVPEPAAIGSLVVSALLLRRRRQVCATTA